MMMTPSLCGTSLHRFTNSLKMGIHTPEFHPMINAFAASLDEDLQPFVDYLRSRGVPFRVTEEGNSQVLWVPSPDVKELVLEWYQQYQDGELVLSSPRVTASRQVAGLSMLANLLKYPLTLASILVTLVAFPFTFGLPGELFGRWLADLTLIGFREDGTYVYFDTLAGTFERMEFWRLVTPMFIHFGWIHIVFNLLWLWEFGRRIEQACGSIMLAVIMLLCSVSANLLQYEMAGPSLFGGMSGVVYGLLGFSLVWSKLWPERDMGMQNGIYIFMLIFLALGFTGAVDLLGFGSIANGAHLGGLLMGLVLGGLVAAIQKRRSAG